MYLWKVTYKNQPGNPISLAPIGSIVTEYFALNGLAINEAYAALEYLFRQKPEGSFHSISQIEFIDEITVQ